MVMVPSDIPVEIYRIWTDPRTNENLDTLYAWSYGRVMMALDWLDALDEAEMRAAKR